MKACTQGLVAAVEPLMQVAPHGLDEGGHEGDLVAALSQVVVEDLLDIGLVFDDKDLRHGRIV